MLKSVVGSVIGAAIGVGLHYGIKQSTGEAYIWLPVVIGALTGLVARIAGGQAPTNSGRYMSGIAAGLIALVAIFGIDFIENMPSGNGEFGPLPDRSTSRVEQPADDEAETATEDATEGDGETGESAESEDSQSGTDEAGSDSENENESSDDATTDDASGDGASSEETAENAPLSQQERSMARRSSETTIPEGDSDAAKERFAELVGKRAHESWYNLYMPYIFSGIGVLMAYQLARGFGSAPKK